MPNKDKIEILNKIIKSLNNLDKLVVINGYEDLWTAKQLTATLITILTIEEKMDENTISK